jgi:acyl-CoA reductase-like NAD-dependent aldehyde dehydrogenase
LSSTAGTLNPADLSALPPLPAPLDVATAVDRARAAQSAWLAKSRYERELQLLVLTRKILERREDYARLISSETGRSFTDSLISEVATAKAHCQAAIAVSRVALAPEKLPISMLDYPGKRGVVEAVPRGVVGIISPWNYPFTQIFRHLVPALLAGNAIVIKPSEHTPRTALWLAERCAEALPDGLVTVATGDGEVGAKLIELADAIVFTGSERTGRRIAARCGERLIPCTVELGATDAAIVLADCDLDRTVAGLVNWSMTNAGQDCSSIERVYVEAAIADTLVERLKTALGRMTVYSGTGEADIGVLQSEAQRAIVEDHVADAIARGATLVCGGRRTGTGYGYLPTLLDNVPADATLCSAETFGPVLPIIRVQRAEDAIALVNAAPSGLNGSVWTKDLARGEAIARRLEVGVALVNNHSITGTMPHAPWSGVKGSGHGVAMSRHAYAAYTRRKVIFVDNNSKPDPWWFPKDASLGEFAGLLARRDLGSFTALFGLLGALGKRVQAVRDRARG